MHFSLSDALSLHVRVFLFDVLFVHPKIVALFLEFVVFDLTGVVLLLRFVEFHDVLA